MDPLSAGLERRFRAGERVLARAVGDETVLLDLATGRYFDLDPTGSRIWELLSPGSRLSDALERLDVEFDAPRERLEQDLLALVAELEREGLLVEDD